jgi:hypothetical protein
VSLAEARATLAGNSAAARRETLDSSLVGVLEDRGMLGGDEIHLPATARCERLKLTDPTQLRPNLLDRSHAASICTT